MEHPGETGLPMSKAENNSLRPENTDRPQQGQPEDEYESNLGYKPISYYQLKTAAEREARRYMASKPMNDSSARNVSLHGSISRLFDGIGEQSTFNDLVVMRESIDYRMNQVMAATMYKNFWDIDMPDCHEVDVEALFVGEDMIDSIFGLVCLFNLFDTRSASQGHIYAKGYIYIACCIDRAGWGYYEAVAKLDMLVVQYRIPWYSRITVPNVKGASWVTAMARRIMSDYEDSVRVELEKIPPCVKLKILSGYPSNRPRKGILEGSVEGRSRDAFFWDKWSA